MVSIYLLGPTGWFRLQISDSDKHHHEMDLT